MATKIATPERNEFGQLTNAAGLMVDAEGRYVGHDGALLAPPAVGGGGGPMLYSGHHPACPYAYSKTMLGKYVRDVPAGADCPNKCGPAEAV